jgi:hypothetical protein
VAGQWYEFKCANLQGKVIKLVPTSGLAITFCGIRVYGYGATGDWGSIPQKGQAIDVDDLGNAYVVTKAGSIHWVNPASSAANKWQQLPGTASDIAASDKVYAIDY